MLIFAVTVNVSVWYCKVPGPVIFFVSINMQIDSIFSFFQSPFLQGCRSRGFWVEPEPFLFPAPAQAPTPTPTPTPLYNMLFLGNPNFDCILISLRTYNNRLKK